MRNRDLLRKRFPNVHLSLRLRAYGGKRVACFAAGPRGRPAYFMGSIWHEDTPARYSEAVMAMRDYREAFAGSVLRHLGAARAVAFIEPAARQNDGAAA